MVRILIYSIIFVNLLSANEPKSLDQFIADYLMLAKSKMESSPTVGQDIKEGYDRHVALYKADLILDSLKYEQVSPYLAGIRHFKKIDKIRNEILSGKEFNHYLQENKKPNFNVNYFSTSKD